MNIYLASLLLAHFSATPEISCFLGAAVPTLKHFTCVHLALIWQQSCVNGTVYRHSGKMMSYSIGLCSKLYILFGNDKTENFKTGFS
jgi:hypothetical protein